MALRRNCKILIFFICLLIVGSLFSILARFRVFKKRGKPILESAHSPSVSPTPPPVNGPTFVPLRKSNLKVNNGGTDMPESLNRHSPVHLGFMAHPQSVSATTPSLYQQANGTTFVPVRRSNLKVNSGGTDMPESLNHSPVYHGFWLIHHQCQHHHRHINRRTVLHLYQGEN
ncbi:hypothetical protein H5410_058714 [Solanum commersonii]|uniref:Uncharacterized protein n=1 Tax=Solanum commersonii TaxID=4109 RepID=A0A9J5WTZ5_SOLCO|nr:hypothetical protein H5410_058714 [Solanum commersonii]